MKFLVPGIGLQVVTAEGDTQINPGGDFAHGLFVQLGVTMSLAEHGHEAQINGTSVFGRQHAGRRLGINPG